MQRIIQEDATGCGLACVAMVARVTYRDVRHLAVEWLGFDPFGPFYTTIYDLRDLLREYGYCLSRNTPFRTFQAIDPLCLLELKRPGEHNHWVLSVKCALDRYILDPAPHIRTDKRRDWRRIQVVSYANIRNEA
jgi:hypothetical protein